MGAYPVALARELPLDWSTAQMKADPPDGALRLWQRITFAVVGIAALSASCIAIFGMFGQPQSANQAATTALVALGFIALALAVIGLVPIELSSTGLKLAERKLLDEVYQADPEEPVGAILETVPELRERGAEARLSALQYENAVRDALLRVVGSSTLKAPAPSPSGDQKFDFLIEPDRIAVEVKVGNPRARQNKHGQRMSLYASAVAARAKNYRLLYVAEDADEFLERFRVTIDGAAVEVVRWRTPADDHQLAEAIDRLRATDRVPPGGTSL